MAPNDLVQPVAAAVTYQVKLCPYDEEEPHIWFRLIEAQFAAASIKSQELKYANALPSLPKQVLWDILDTLVSALTSVSVPISPRKQRQLALISEFNIQMLYLPSLINIVADFLSQPSPPELTGIVAAAAAADPVDFKAMAAEQNSCAETQRLLGGTSLKLAFR
jgi:hypothetical protein